MGDVVAKKAAAETIMGDVDTTLTRARARGGKWAELAEKMLANAIKLHGLAWDEREKAEVELRTLVASVDAQDDLADKLVAQISDDVWNKIGRPSFDPTYDVVFPSGITYYSGGPDADQPERMELLAQLLEMNIIARLPEADAKDMAGRLRAAVENYRKALAPVAGPRARMQMFERALTAVAHSGQIALAHLKRLYRTEGFSEAEIHTVIPDRPRKKPVAAKAVAPAPNVPAA
jgi:hypothetical protein